MTIRFFSDEDRERMRRDEELQAQFDEWFWEHGVRMMGVASRDPGPSERMHLLQIRPWG